MIETKPTKAKLLDRIARERAALEEQIGALSEAELVSPGRDGWTVKDHLAHLAAWEAGVAALVQHKPRYPAMGAGVEEAVRSGSGFDAPNDIIYHLHKDKSLRQVLDYYHDSHQQLLAALAPLDDADLMNPYSHFAPNESLPDADDPILGWIVGNTYGHYEEHAKWIKELTSELSRPRQQTQR